MWWLWWLWWLWWRWCGRGGVGYSLHLSSGRLKTGKTPGIVGPQRDNPTPPLSPPPPPPPPPVPGIARLLVVAGGNPNVDDKATADRDRGSATLSGKWQLSAHRSILAPGCPIVDRISGEGSATTDVVDLGTSPTRGTASMSLPDQTSRRSRSRASGRSRSGTTPSHAGHGAANQSAVDVRGPTRHFDPCAATASMLLYAQGAAVLCLHHDTLALERRFQRHSYPIVFIAVDNVSERGAGRNVVSYDADQTAIVWDILTGDEIARFVSYDHINVAAWMRNGNVAFGESVDAPQLG